MVSTRTRIRSTATMSGYRYLRRVRYFSTTALLVYPLNDSVTFVNVSDPYSVPSSPEPDRTPTEAWNSLHEQDNEATEANDAEESGSSEAHTRGLEALSTAALYLPPEDITLQESVTYQGGDFEDMNMTTVGGEVYAPTGLLPPRQSALAPPSRDLDLILNPASSLASAIGPSLQTSDSDQGPPAAFQRYSTSRGAHKASTETNQKTAFLLRYFSEVTGRWYVHDAQEKLCRLSC